MQFGLGSCTPCEKYRTTSGILDEKNRRALLHDEQLYGHFPFRERLFTRSGSKTVLFFARNKSHSQVSPRLIVFDVNANIRSALHFLYIQYKFTISLSFSAGHETELSLTTQSSRNGRRKTLLFIVTRV